VEKRITTTMRNEVGWKHLAIMKLYIDNKKVNIILETLETIRANYLTMKISIIKAYVKTELGEDTQLLKFI
jgi:hypothetical protein